MTEPLSQHEIEQLLNGINAGDSEKEKEEQEFRPSPTKKIKVYDFERQDKFSRDQIRNISITHETFARLATNSLCAQIRAIARIHVASVDQLTHEEFIRSIPTPTCLCIINPEPLKCNWLLEIDPAITFAILNRLLGGTAKGVKSHHELTDIEQSIMEDIIAGLLDNLRESWEHIFDLKPHMAKIDTNPNNEKIVPLNEMGVLITLETMVGDVEGMINIFIPYVSVEPVIGKLSDCWQGTSSRRSDAVVNPEVLDGTLVTVKAEYLKIQQTAKEVSGYKAGTVLLAHEAQAPYTGNIVVGHTTVAKFKRSDTLKDKQSVEIIETHYSLEENYMEEKHNVQIQDNGFDNVEVQVICELGRTVSTIGNVKRFKEGTLLELDKLAGEPVDVFVNNVLLAKGEVVVIDEHFGIRLSKILDGNEAAEEHK